MLAGILSAWFSTGLLSYVAVALFAHRHMGSAPDLGELPMALYLWPRFIYEWVIVYLRDRPWWDR